MPDPISTTTAIAAAAGKKAVEKGESYLALLLKPSLELAGKELRSVLKEKIDDYKKQKREENLKGHIDRARLVFESKRGKPAPSKTTISTLECFEAWADGAQEVEPEANVLGSMWQRILIELASGELVQKQLIEKLRGMTLPEAKVLMQLRDSEPHSRYPIDEEERDILDSLRAKGIARVDYHRTVAALIFIAVSWLIASAVSSMMPIHTTFVNFPLIGSYSPFDLITKWQFALLFLVTTIGYFALNHSKGFGRWRLTRLGTQLVSYATPTNTNPTTQSKLDSDESTSRPIVPQDPSSPPTGIDSALESEVEAKSKTTPKITAISHAEMVEHIMRVPPIQRDSIEQHYIGLRVQWIVALSSSAQISKDEVMLHAFTLPERHTLECHARPENFSCLLHLPEGGEFLLEGTLKLVGRAFCILNDCSASLIPKK